MKFIIDFIYGIAFGISSSLIIISLIEGIRSVL